LQLLWTSPSTACFSRVTMWSVGKHLIGLAQQIQNSGLFEHIGQPPKSTGLWWVFPLQMAKWSMLIFFMGNIPITHLSRLDGDWTNLLVFFCSMCRCSVKNKVRNYHPGKTVRHLWGDIIYIYI
jgi:hypothetical protein